MESDHPKINGRTLEPRLTELSVTGIRGRFVYLYTDKNGDLICWGGPPHRPHYRAFRPSRHTFTIHRKTTRKRTQ